MTLLVGLVASLLSAGIAPAAAAPAEGDSNAPRRTRIALGPQVVPSFPGANGVSVRPLVDVARASGDELFAFEAPDESFGPTIVRSENWQIGPAIGFEGQRSQKDTGGMLPKVGFTFEVGGFVQYQVLPQFRLRTEVRQGIGGHKGLIGTIGADYVVRDGDRWLFSIGPRVTLANGQYNQAYFGIDHATSTLPAFHAAGGLQAAGAAASFTRQIDAGWGIYSYAKYDRLINDPGRSPVVRGFGARDQLSGGVALSYSFGR